MSSAKSCWECIKKRRVCDAATPQCQKCVGRGIACPGYDENKPLKWLNPGQTRSKGRRAKNEERQTTRALVRASIPFPAQIQDSGAAVMEAVRYYNERIAPDLVAIPWPAQGTYLLEESYLPYMSPSLLEGIVCTSLAHRILQTSHKMHSEDSLVLVKRLQVHRGNAIKLIADELSGDWADISDLTLSSLLSLLLTEMQQCISPIWIAHCDAVHAALEARGGLRAQLMANIDLEPMLRYYVATEILGASTTPNISLRQAERQLEIIDLLPALFGTGITTSIPCPAPLMQEIILITHRRAVNTLTEPSKEEAFVALMTILNRIRRFSVESWIEDVTNAQNRIIVEANLEDEATSHVSPDSNLQWLHIGLVFQAAVALYCLSSLSPMESGDDSGLYIDGSGDNELSFIRESCRRSLLGNLKEIASGSGQHPRKMVLWPHIIAGLVTRDDDDGARSFILSELVWISRALGTASPLIACELLKRLWKCPNTTSRRWDDLFDRPYCFSI